MTVFIALLGLKIDLLLGLWEVLTPNECVEFVLQHSGEDPTWVCEELTKIALKKTPYPDNITVVLVNFQSNGRGQH